MPAASEAKPVQPVVANPQELPLHIAEIIVSDDDLDMGFSDAFIEGRLKLPKGMHKLYTLNVLNAAPIPPAQLGEVDQEAVFASMSQAAYEEFHSDVVNLKPWTYLSPGEWNKWMRVANAVEKARCTAEGVK